MIDLDKGSFRDPSGFVFYKDGQIYRQVNESYKDNYELLMSSGLYDELIKEGLLIPHTEVDSKSSCSNECYKLIKPEMVNFISYPYEWCFSQIKDAALATVRIQKLALARGMSLKDSSAYNIQFVNGKPTMIDTLSFEKYEEGKPWVAYGQFCRHFYAPLVLMAYKDIRLNQLLRCYIDGIPLDLASSMLPGSTKFNFSIMANIHLHAKTQANYSDKAVDVKKYTMSKMQLSALIDSLESAVNKLKLDKVNTEWGDYYNATNYSDDAFNHKKQLVESFLQTAGSRYIWDLGANTGVFSRLASDKGIETIAFDIDPIAVEKNYLHCKQNQEKSILPILMDLTNPSPSLGWSNEERMSFKGRKLPDTVLALALIHHLAISNNLPFSKIAKFFSEICSSLIIEFVPKGDSQVNKLLATREDIFDQYHQEGFEKEFSKYYTIQQREKIQGSDRTLYLLKRK